ncbi:MAG: glycosyl transferase, partial [Alphaproteobacteria bacterium]
MEALPIWLVVATAGLIAGVASWTATGIVLKALERRAILDRPNQRSSHATPTARGGGLALIPVLIVVWGAGALVLPASAPALDVVLALIALLAA